MQETEFKKICGQLIGYYRKSYYQKTKSYQYTIRGMIMKTGNERDLVSQKTICSSTTLRQIESGLVKENENLYFYLTPKIHKKYCYSRQYLTTLQALIEKVYQTVEKMDLAKMQTLLKKLKQSPLSYYLYYAENIEILCYLLDFYLHQKLPDQKELERFIELIDLLPEVIKKMIIHLFGEYYRRIDFQPAKLISFLEHQTWKSFDYLTLYTLIPPLISMRQFLKANQFLKQLKASPDFHNNAYKKLYYYNMIGCIQFNIDIDGAYQSLQHCLSIIQDTSHIPTVQRAAINHNFGIFFFYKRQYTKAIHYFMSAAKYHPKMVLPSLPYLFQSVQKAKKDLSLVTQALHIYQRSKQTPQGLFFHYYRYFMLRCQLPLSKQTAAALEYQIIHHILPALKVSDQMHYSYDLREFFIHELCQLNTLTQSHWIVQKI